MSRDRNNNRHHPYRRPSVGSEGRWHTPNARPGSPLAEIRARPYNPNNIFAVFNEQYDGDVSGLSESNRRLEVENEVENEQAEAESDADGDGSGVEGRIETSYWPDIGNYIVNQEGERPFVRCAICFNEVVVTGLNDQDGNSGLDGEHTHHVIVCGHVFGLGCILTWIYDRLRAGKNPPCPICRQLVFQSRAELNRNRQFLDDAERWADHYLSAVDNNDDNDEEDRESEQSESGHSEEEDDLDPDQEDVAAVESEMMLGAALDAAEEMIVRRARNFPGILGLPLQLLQRTDDEMMDDDEID